MFVSLMLSPTAQYPLEVPPGRCLVTTALNEVRTAKANRKAIQLPKVVSDSNDEHCHPSSAWHEEPHTQNIRFGSVRSGWDWRCLQLSVTQWAATTFPSNSNHNHPQLARVGNRTNPNPTVSGSERNQFRVISRFVLFLCGRPAHPRATTTTATEYGGLMMLFLEPLVKALSTAAATTVKVALIIIITLIQPIMVSYTAGSWFTRLLVVGQEACLWWTWNLFHTHVDRLAVVVVIVSGDTSLQM